MKHRLLGKLLTVYLTFVLIVILTVPVVSRPLLYRYEINKKVEGILNKIRSTSDSITRDDMMILNTSYNLDHILRLLAYYDHLEIWLVRDDGTITYVSNQQHRRMIGNKIKDFNDNNKQYYTIGKFNDAFTDKVLTVNFPVVHDDKVIGYVVSSYPMSDIVKDVDDIMVYIYLISAVILLISLMLPIIFYKSIYKNIILLDEGVEELAKGNMRHKFELEESEDELSHMAINLGYMAQRIGENEEYQRRLIANVSHDFRSPLTSIKGYVEAMLDGTISIEQQPRYLGIVLKETKRLNELTTGLLALNDMDAGGLKLEKKTFDINEVIKDTVSSFEGRLEKADIKCNLVFVDKESLVFADINRIKQVIYNLVDNAIKFSKDHTCITIETGKCKNKLKISIKDEGCGIDGDALPHIFDRFYKSDPSRNRDRNSSGLGLSIVKEIINLHGENIQTVSTVGVGTTFIFSLPLVAAMD